MKDIVIAAGADVPGGEPTRAHRHLCTLRRHFCSAPLSEAGARDTMYVVVADRHFMVIKKSGVVVVVGRPMDGWILPKTMASPQQRQPKLARTYRSLAVHARRSRRNIRETDNRKN
jgi:hypothetical protein